MANAHRAEVEDLGNNIYRVILHYGFMEDPDVPDGLKQVRSDGLDFRPMHTSYFLGRETLLITRQPGMARWRERLFSLISPTPLTSSGCRRTGRWNWAARLRFDPSMLVFPILPFPT